MTWIVRMFHQGGHTMFTIRDLAVLGIVIAGVHLFVRRQQWSRWAVLAIIVLTVIVGAYGTLDGRRMIDREIDDDIANGHAEYAEQEREAGYAEAMRPIQFAGIVAGGLVVLFGIGELVRRRHKPVAVVA